MQEIGVDGGFGYWYGGGMVIVFFWIYFLLEFVVDCEIEIVLCCYVIWFFDGFDVVEGEGVVGDFDGFVWCYFDVFFLFEVGDYGDVDDEDGNIEMGNVYVEEVVWLFQGGVQEGQFGMGVLYVFDEIEQVV